MSISALSSTSSTSELSFLSRLSSSNSNSSADTVRRPPPPEGGGFADAIAEALKAVGITDTSDPGTGTDASGTATTGASATDASSTAATDNTDSAAAALGTFLQSLMGALHAQNSGDSQTSAPYGEGHHHHGGGHGGGAGKLESDLQSLISKLGTGTDDTSTTSTDGTDAVGDLESSFANLLDKLGVDTSNSTGSTTSASVSGAGATDSNGSTGGSDASVKLAAFLQALSTKVGASGTSGNLVNTTV